jgi:hypothetical protein
MVCCPIPLNALLTVATDCAWDSAAARAITCAAALADCSSALAFITISSFSAFAIVATLATSVLTCDGLIAAISSMDTPPMLVVLLRSPMGGVLI